MKEKRDMEFIIPNSCGNSPKKKLICDIHIGLAHLDTTVLLEQLSENIIWDFVGNKKLMGISQITEFLSNVTDYFVKRLELNHVITHGKEASCDGYIILENNKVYHFSHIIEFDSFKTESKIRIIKSFIVETD